MTRAPSSRISIRPALDSDRTKLATLIHFSPYVHRHLDWRSPLDWLGDEPFFVAERDEQILAALACPPDIPDLTWVRLFAVSTALTVDDAWDRLWPVVLRLLGDEVPVAVLPLQSWFQRILAASDFEHHHDVVMLKWHDHGQGLDSSPPASPYSLRLMNYDDIDAVYHLDQAAFDAVWRHSRDLLKIAFKGAAIATVAEDDEGLVGYQVSTVNANDGHLARLAVHPRGQRMGVGFTLLNDLLCGFRRRGVPKVTVNTQTHNLASLNLYEKVGFVQTGETYPIYQINN